MLFYYLIFHLLKNDFHNLNIPILLFFFSEKYVFYYNVIYLS